MLFNRGRRGLALEHFDICGDRDRLNVFKVLITGSFTPEKKLLDRPVISGPGVRVADRDVKNSKNFLRVDAPAPSMRIGAGKFWGETTASSESDIALKGYPEGSPFDQS